MKTFVTIFSVAVAFVLIACAQLLTTQKPTVHAQTFVPCHFFFPGTVVPLGFGVPYNPYTNSQLLAITCNGTDGTVVAGDGSASTFVHQVGYEFQSGVWEPFTFAGNKKQGEWLAGKGEASIPGPGTNPRYVVAFTCLWDGARWRCGCRDRNCSQSFWQLQVAQIFTWNTGSSGGGGTISSSGGFSSSSGGGATCGGGQCSPCQACGGNCNQCGGNRTIWVDAKNGSDNNNGFSQGQAFKTIQKGARTVRGGDVMIVRPGKYYERPKFSSLGTSANKPVWILSEIPGEATISGLWKAADQGTVNWRNDGNGVYSASHGDAYSGSYNGKFLFRYKSRSDLQAGSVAGVKKPPYGFSPSGGRVYVRLPGNANPNGKSVKITDTFSRTVVTIGSPYVILDGFAIAGAGNTWAVDVNSQNVTLRNLNVTHSRMAAQTPNNTLIEWTEYSYPGFYNFVEDIIDLNGAGGIGVFDLVKEYFSNNGNAYLEGGLATADGSNSSNNEFRYNYIHEVFDGERLGEFNDSVTHHNVYNYNYDDHIQLEGWRNTHNGRNLRVHDNLFLNSRATMLSHQNNSGGMQGPQYLYRNVIYVTDPKHAHPWTVIKNRYVKNKNIYYYHNVINNVAGNNKGWGGTNWLYWDAGAGSAEKLTFRNNIILFDNLSSGKGGTPTFGNNVLINNKNIGKITAGGGKYVGRDKNALKFINLNNLNFGIQAGSPAENAGGNLPGSWPDTHKGAIRGAPDAGAFEVGENPGNNWPRPRSTSYTIEKPDDWK